MILTENFFTMSYFLGCEPVSPQLHLPRNLWYMASVMPKLRYHIALFVMRCIGATASRTHSSSDYKCISIFSWFSSFYWVIVYMHHIFICHGYNKAELSSARIILSWMSSGICKWGQIVYGQINAANCCLVYVLQNDQDYHYSGNKLKIIHWHFGTCWIYPGDTRAIVETGEFSFWLHCLHCVIRFCTGKTLFCIMHQLLLAATVWHVGQKCMKSKNRNFMLSISAVVTYRSDVYLPLVTDMDFMSSVFFISRSSWV